MAKLPLLLRQESKGNTNKLIWVDCVVRQSVVSIHIYRRMSGPIPSCIPIDSRAISWINTHRIRTVTRVYLIADCLDYTCGPSGPYSQTVPSCHKWCSTICMFSASIYGLVQIMLLFVAFMIVNFCVGGIINLIRERLHHGGQQRSLEYVFIITKYLQTWLGKPY